jgi:hypothetical protein
MQNIENGIDIDSLSTKEIMSRLIFIGEEIISFKQNRSYYQEKLKKALQNKRNVELIMNYERIKERDNIEPGTGKKRGRDSRTDIMISNNKIKHILQNEEILDRQKSANNNSQTVKIINQSINMSRPEYSLEENERFQQYTSDSNRRIIQNVNTYNTGLLNHLNSSNISPDQLKTSEFRFNTISPIQKRFSDTSPLVSQNNLSNNLSIKPSNLNITPNNNVTTQRINLFDKTNLPATETRHLISTINVQNLIKFAGISELSSLFILAYIDQDSQISKFLKGIIDNINKAVYNNQDIVKIILIGLAVIVIVAILIKKFKEIRENKYRISANNLILLAEKTLMDLKYYGNEIYSIDADDFIKNFCMRNDINDKDIRFYMNDALNERIAKSNIEERLYYGRGIIRRKWTLK